MIINWFASPFNPKIWYTMAHWDRFMMSEILKLDFFNETSTGASEHLPKHHAHQALFFPPLPMPYFNDSPSLLSLLRWQKFLHHRMLQPTHLIRMPSDSASKWLQLPKWDAVGTLTTHPQPLQILLGAVTAPEQRQTYRNKTSATTGAAAVEGCGASSIAQRLQQAVAHWRVGGAESCQRRSSCGRLWSIGASASRHSVQGTAAVTGCGASTRRQRGIVSDLSWDLCVYLWKYKTIFCIRHPSIFIDDIPNS